MNSSVIESEAEKMLRFSVRLLNQSRYRKALKYAESALRMYRNCESSFGIMRALDVKGSIHYNLCEYNSFVRANQEILELARNENDLQMQMRALSSISDAHSIMGLKENSVDEAKSALALATQLGDKVMEFNIQGQLLYAEWKTKASLHCYEKSLELSRRESDYYSIAWTLTNISNVYLRDGAFSRALDCLHQARSIVEAHQFSIDCHLRIEAKICNCLGIAEHNLGNLGKSMSHLRAGLRASRQSNDRFFEAAILTNIGLVEGKRGKNDAAINRHLRALETFRSMGARHEQACCLLFLGDDYFSKRQIKNAIENYQAALQLSNECYEREIEANSYGGLFDVACCIGDLESALLYARKRMHVATSLGDKCQEQGAHQNFGHVYMLLGDTPLSLKYLSRSCEMALLHGDRMAFCKTLCSWGQLGELAEDGCLEQMRAIDRLCQANELSRAIGFDRGLRESSYALMQEPTHRISHDLLLAQRNGIFVDIFLSGNEDDSKIPKIPAHKSLLASRSIYFCDLIHNTQENDDLRVSICPTDALKVIIDFIYTDSLCNRENICRSLLRDVARRMKLDRLVWLLTDPITASVSEYQSNEFAANRFADDLKLLYDGSNFSGENNQDTTLRRKLRVQKKTDLHLKIPLKPDVAIIAEGQRIWCHRAILASRSWFFRKLLDVSLLMNSTEPSDVTEVNLVDVSFAAAQALVYYIYCGRIWIQNCDVLELLVIADKYQMSYLKRLLEILISKNLEHDNVVSILLCAEIYNASWLTRKCVQYILSHYDEVLKTEEWEALSEALRHHIEEMHESRRQASSSHRQYFANGNTDVSRISLTRSSIQRLLYSGRRLFGLG